MIFDENVEKTRKVREDLIAKHGGLKGWIRHLQELEKSRKQKAKKPRSKVKK